MNAESAPDVDVWRIDLDADPQSVAGSLSEAEADRAARLRGERDRRRFIVAHGVQRAVLASYLEIQPREVAVAVGAEGKPELASGALHFNLAHSGSVAVLAVSRGRRVGVDIELVRSVRYRARLVDRMFSAQEASAYSAAPESERDRAFLEIWTRKEAVLKAIGVGIGEQLGTISVPHDGTTTEFRGLWTVRDLRPEGEYVGAVAAEGSGLVVRCHHYQLG